MRTLQYESPVVLETIFEVTTFLADLEHLEGMLRCGSKLQLSETVFDAHSARLVLGAFLAARQSVSALPIVVTTWQCQVFRSLGSTGYVHVHHSMAVARRFRERLLGVYRTCVASHSTL